MPKKILGFSLRSHEQGEAGAGRLEDCEQLLGQELEKI